MRFYIGWALMLVGSFVALQMGMAGYIVWAAICAAGAVVGLGVCVLEIQEKAKGGE
jgi:hypothetical protein